MIDLIAEMLRRACTVLAKRLVVATAVALVTTCVALTQPVAAAPPEGAVEVVEWMSADEYAAATGLSAAAIDSLPSKGIPDRFRVRLDDGSVTEPISGSDMPKVGDGPRSAPGFDPAVATTVSGGASSGAVVI
ncbi:hypothetical protein [Micromonospora sp. NPDC049799]|uniref:hypothetical protein n=1 Tax=Micromonospora sp. NPDC049799 TaxID=3154741 RepID=UPI0034006737